MNLNWEKDPGKYFLKPVFGHFQDMKHNNKRDSDSYNSDRNPTGVEEINDITELEEKQELLGWDLLRHKLIGGNNTFDNDMGHVKVKKKCNPFYAMAFFNVVKEATAVEKKKKERPTLEKYLEKFDSCHPPESATPNAQPGSCHSEVITSIKDDDTKLLRNSLFRISGECLELATPTLKVQTIIFLSYKHYLTV